MIVTGLKRGTPEWRAAHRNRVTASDARELMARRETKSYRSLVTRLVLDREGVDNHEDEHPDPWAERHEFAVNAALACYRRSIAVVSALTVDTPGLLLDDELNWLGCTPHGLVGARGVAMMRPRSTLRAYKEKASVYTPVDRARAQIILRVTGREWVDVVDFLDGLGRVADRFVVQRMHAEPDWLSGTVFPRLLALWEDVARSMKDRRTL